MYGHTEEISNGIESIIKQFAEFKVVYRQYVEILGSFTFLVKDFKTVKI